MGNVVGWERLAQPCLPTTAGAPQERCVFRRGQGEDECGGADRPDEAASERLCEGKTEEPAAPSQPSPGAQHPAYLQSGNVLPAAQRPESVICPHSCSQPMGSLGQELE